MLRLRSATAIIAMVTVAVSAIAILFGGRRMVGGVRRLHSGADDQPVAGPGRDPGGLYALDIGVASRRLAASRRQHAGAGVCRRQVERVVGASALVLAYLVGALVAAAAQFAVDPASTVPLVGASGAISALFGLYALFFGRPKQVTKNQKLNRWIHAAWLLATWVVLQWMAGFLAGGEGILLATPAHIGGFIAGMLLQRPLLLWRYRKA